VIDTDIDHKNLPGANFHASPQGVIDTDVDHKNLPGANFHASPQGVIDTDIDHQIQGFKALDFAETPMFRCRQSKFGEFQQPIAMQQDDFRHTCCVLHHLATAGL
jgi:hypothetical protein